MVHIKLSYEDAEELVALRRVKKRVLLHIRSSIARQRRVDAFDIEIADMREKVEGASQVQWRSYTLGVDYDKLLVQLGCVTEGEWSDETDWMIPEDMRVYLEVNKLESGL